MSILLLTIFICTSSLFGTIQATLSYIRVNSTGYYVQQNYTASHPDGNTTSVAVDTSSTSSHYAKFRFEIGNTGLDKIKGPAEIFCVNCKGGTSECLIEMYLCGQWESENWNRVPQDNVPRSFILVSTFLKNTYQCVTYIPNENVLKLKNCASPPSTDQLFYTEDADV